MTFQLNSRCAVIEGLPFGNAVLLAALTTCSREPPPQTVVAAAPSPQAVVVVQPAQPVAVAQPAPAPPIAVQVQADVVMPDDYVYYPQYELYYSSSRSQFGYWEGNAWLWRPAPPNVAASVVFASASVRMDFHDSPALHRESVARSYPRNWSGPAKGRDVRTERSAAPREEHNDRDDRH
jgi:hypothetical protein